MARQEGCGAAGRCVGVHPLARVEDIYLLPLRRLAEKKISLLSRLISHFKNAIEKSFLSVQKKASKDSPLRLFLILLFLR